MDVNNIILIEEKISENGIFNAQREYWFWLFMLESQRERSINALTFDFFAFNN